MRRLSLSAQVASVVAVLIVGNAIFAFLAFDRMSAMNKSIASITGVALPRVSEGFALRDILRRVAVLERALLAEDNKDGVASVNRELLELSGVFERNLNLALNSATAGGKDVLSKVKASYARWRGIEQQVQAAVEAGHMSAAMKLANEQSRVLMQEIQTGLSQYVDVNKNSMDEENERTDAEYTKSRDFLTFGIVAIILFGSIMAFLVMFRLTRSINEIVGHLNSNSGKVQLAAQQIAMSSEELSESVTRQAREIDRTTRKVREMNGVVQKNAAHATKACELSLYSESAAKKGSQVVANMISAITVIDEANAKIMSEIDESNRQVAEMVRVIGEIGEKTRVINDIVIQTKLLSFNASAEATRAGENGRGFAIIADEIRALAQTSGAAARDITMMLDGSILKVDEIVKGSRERVTKLVDECSEKVKSGTKIAGDCGHVLEEIVSHVGEVNKAAFEISNATDVQAEGIAELFKTFKRIDGVTNETSMVAVETSKIGEQLIGESKLQRQVVAVLIRAVRGGRGPAPSLTATPSDSSKTAEADPAVVSGRLVDPEPPLQAPQAEAAAPAPVAVEEPAGPASDSLVPIGGTGDRSNGKGLLVAGGSVVTLDDHRPDSQAAAPAKAAGRDEEPKVSAAAG